ncbi:hypothetical protein HDU81_005636 [Chytriomyces hyalinus]|nr:hypothetical protein HDU81_005636 [Chytriomyces hyalinus]
MKLTLTCRIANFITMCENPAAMIQARFIMIAPKTSALILSNHKSEFKGPCTWTAKELRTVAGINADSDHSESECNSVVPQSLNVRDEFKQSDGQAHSNIKGTAAQMNNNGGLQAEVMKFHAERRTCLAYQLRRLVDVLQMSVIPLLEFQSAMMCLSLSKDEMVWYFNSSSKRDTGVVELLWLVKSVQSLELSVFQQEIMQRIWDSDVSSTLFQMENYLDINSDTSACMAEYANLVSIANDILCEDGGTEVLSSGVSTTFRDSWLRFQVLAVLPNSDFPESSFLADITPPLGLIYSKMQFLDDFDSVVGEVGSFAKLFHVSDRVVSELKEFVREAHPIENYYSAFCWIAKDFMELVSVEASDIEVFNKVLGSEVQALIVLCE